MIKKIVIVFLLFFAFAGSASAQNWDTVWTFAGQQPLNQYFRKLRFDFDLDARNSFDGGGNSRIFGFRAGLEYRRVHRFGVGVYGMTNPWFSLELLTSEQFDGQSKYRLNYGTAYYERVLFFSPKWEFATALHLGSGNIDIERRKNERAEYEPFDQIWVTPVEGALTGFYNVFWWFSAGGGVGYRLMPQTPEAVEPAFTGEFYMVKLKVRVGKLARSIFDKDVKHEY
jgi:hypothetical protein